MQIGIPKEVKAQEGRVALVPEACSELVRAGHRVMLQAGAGMAAGYTDAAYAAAGVDLLPDAASLYGEAELLLKVKEPQPAELDLLRRDQLLFSYLHLAAEPALTARLLEIGLTAVAFETVQTPHGLPLLAPMSIIAGRLSVQVGTHLLHGPQGGKGVLLGGLPGVERGRVVILGAGQAGGNAAVMAAGLGAEVTVFDRNPQALERMHALGPNVSALFPYTDRLSEAVAGADLLIGAVLIPGAAAPHLVSRTQIACMAPGSVAVDISVDQGGCLETTRPTTYDAPTYVDSGVTHFCVTNMPGGVARTATQALSANLLPYVQRLARPDWREDAALAAGINLARGELLHPALRKA